MTRNTSNASHIKELLRSNRTPLLPFEGIALTNRFRSLTAEQEKMGQLLGEAMSQGAENWDDNAPADVINRDALVRVSEAHRIMNILHHAVMVDYPTETDQATLGSLVGVRFGRSKEAEPMLLTGISRGKTPEIADILTDDTEIITVASPIGKALLGGQVGADVRFRAGEREMSAQIASIEIPEFPETSVIDLSILDNSPQILRKESPSW